MSRQNSEHTKAIDSVDFGLKLVLGSLTEAAGREDGSAYGIRTRVTGVRGRRPRPLDECATEKAPRKGRTGVAVRGAAL